MSATELVITVGSAAVGAAAGSLAVYFGSRKPGGSAKKQDSSAQQEQPSVERTKAKELISIPKNDLETSKRELKTLLLEKELVSSALTRLYEAEVAKEITREEREILGGKYKTELKSLDDRISKIDAFIQIGDLETLRSQLVQLVTQKMEAIEKRIESTRSLAEPLIAEMLNKKAAEIKSVAPVGEEKKKIPDISDMLRKEPDENLPNIAQNTPDQTTILSVRNTGSSLMTPDQNFSVGKKAGDNKVEELQKELLDALDRLEKLDVET